jgi:hypothetical protein
VHDIRIGISLQLRDPAMHDIPPILWNSLHANTILDPDISSPSKKVFPGAVYSLLGFKPRHRIQTLPRPIGNHFRERSLAGWRRLCQEPAELQATKRTCVLQSIEDFCVDIAVLEMKQAAGIPLCPDDYDLQRELRVAKHAITEALAEDTQRYMQKVEVEANQSHDSASSYRLEMAAKWRESMDQCTRQRDSARQ